MKKNNIQFGASFSHPHLEYLECDPMKALKAFRSLSLTWIRLGCYWNMIETKKGTYDFSKLNPLVEYCEENKINICMTVGMKAPRHPEYYIPEYVLEKTNLRKLTKINSSHKYLEKRVHEFIKQCVTRYKDSAALKVWQVENEALDPSGPNSWRIDESFLAKEVELVRSLDPDKPIQLNAWGNEIGVRRDYPKLAQIGDIVGVDIYLKHEFSVNGKFVKYVGPMHSKWAMKRILNKIRSQGKKIWIVELQAEPWEPSELVTYSENPPSFPPDAFMNNISYAQSLKADFILLWGFEYWYMRKVKMNDDRYWKGAQKALESYKE